MIHTNLVQALEKQIRFCEQYKRYKCGVFVRTQIQREIAAKCISNLLSSSVQVQHRASSHETRFWWENGSCITVLQVSDYVRGHKFNGVVIDGEIDRDVANYSIMPYLTTITYDIEDKRIENFDNVEERVFVVDIKCKDIKESELAQIIKPLVYCSSKIDFSEMRRYDEVLRNAITVGKELGLFKKENKSMFNNHTAAFRVAQVGIDKIYIYNAIGIPKENIKYETEFVNRTKETYLNIKGEYKVEDIGFENEIDVHLLIDTNIYDKYEVEFHDGLVIVVLHEIINEKPVLEDVSSKKGE